MFVIMKSTRLYLGGPGYAGPACQKAGVQTGKIYSDKAEAEADARKLSQANPVGFVVTEHKEQT